MSYDIPHCAVGRVNRCWAPPAQPFLVSNPAGLTTLSPASCQFVPLRSRCSPQHSVLKYLGLCSSLAVADQDSHLNESTGQLYIFYFNLYVLDSRREDKMF
jgi:hypothetical protein